MNTVDPDFFEKNIKAGYQQRKERHFDKGDEPLVGVPFAWTSGQWTWMKLTVVKGASSGWVVEGRAWADGAQTPSEPVVRFEVPTEITAGRAAVWASPFSGTPIRFDDLKWVTH